MFIVALDGALPALKPCRFCGGLEGEQTEPKGPHGNGVKCISCGRHLGWLPKEHDDDDDFDVIDTD